MRFIFVIALTFLAFAARCANPTLAGNNTFTGVNTFNGGETFNGASAFNGNSHMVGNVTFDGFNTFNLADTFNGGETFNGANAFNAANQFNSSLIVNGIANASTLVFNMNGGNAAVVLNTVDGGSSQFQIQDQGNNQWSYGINPGFFGTDILNVCYDQMTSQLVISVAPTTDYVGIMTANPQYPLDVNGTLNCPIINCSSNAFPVISVTNDLVPGRWLVGPKSRFNVRAAVMGSSTIAVPFQGILMYSNAANGSITPADIFQLPSGIGTLTSTNILKLYGATPGSMYCITNTGAQLISVPKINGTAVNPAL